MTRCIAGLRQLQDRLREDLGRDMVGYALFIAIAVLIVTAAARVLGSRSDIVPYSTSQMYNNIMLAK